MRVRDLIKITAIVAVLCSVAQAEPVSFSGFSGTLYNHSQLPTDKLRIKLSIKCNRTDWNGRLAPCLHLSASDQEVSLQPEKGSPGTGHFEFKNILANPGYRNVFVLEVKVDPSYLDQYPSLNREHLRYEKSVIVMDQDEKSLIENLNKFASDFSELSVFLFVPQARHQVKVEVKLKSQPNENWLTNESETGGYDAFIRYGIDFEDDTHKQQAHPYSPKQRITKFVDLMPADEYNPLRRVDEFPNTLIFLPGFHSMSTRFSVYASVRNYRLFADKILLEHAHEGIRFSGYIPAQDRSFVIDDTDF